jgi:hypothetical protein
MALIARSSTMGDVLNGLIAGLVVGAVPWLLASGWSRPMTPFEAGFWTTAAIVGTVLGATHALLKEVKK